MKNKKSLIAIIAVATVAIVGGSIAYFRYTQTFDNEFHLGAQITTFTETFESPDNWTPCTETPKTLVVNNSSTAAINARIKITENWEKLDENGDVIEGESLPLVVDGRNMAVINFANASNWTLKSDGYYYYNNDIPTGGASNSFIESVTFNCDATSEYSSARYHLNLKVETVEASNAARQTAGWI